MVIIAREFAVTGLRMMASEQGEVMSASVLGKVKTVDAGRDGVRADLGRPAGGWVDVLVYVTVAVTVLSGVDYFFRLREAGSPRLEPGAVEPLAHRDVMRGVLAGGDLVRAARRAARSARRCTLCWWIVSRFSWRAETKCVVGQVGERWRRTPPIISRTQSSTKRGRRCAFSTTAASSERFISS